MRPLIGRKNNKYIPKNKCRLVPGSPPLIHVDQWYGRRYNIIYIYIYISAAGAREESSFWIKQRPFQRSVNAGMSRLKSRAKFSFLIGPNTVLLFFIIYNIHPRRIPTASGCYSILYLFILIKYSSPSTDRGLTTVFYALDNDYCFICIFVQGRSASWK